jgi:hypothetical protein
MNRIGKLGLLACLAIGAILVARQGGGQTRPTRSELMRSKLEASRQVLEGLTLEDYALIMKGAKALNRLSKEAVWKVPTIPNADEYLTYTTEFERLTDELSRKAKDKNLDGATLIYFRLTTNCVNCHKYVRSVTR